ncbi:response regulator [Ferribacterium limneticum]|uniref:response regulator n=1 Tax=Ferribacterium limneticum TaxID=76259 RepID=UPI001CFC3328|nr:response regulator [Ferribacterium limneticum]UCV28684.1 response regulator [Ferribacterium limneticum]UCV32601.1 response regulator [Ferribacterium limneticum]
MSEYNKKRFLVIDDQPQARDALRSIAQTIGAFAVEFASNYQDAIFRIRNNAPDIILCDYMLGEGRSGQQLLEELRRFNLLPDETIFMMVTGEQSYEQVVSAVELVPDDYIIKPFSPDKLVLRLDRIVAKKNFFAAYYKEKRQQEFARALAILEAQRASETGRPYRFEILRQQAEVLLASGDAEASEKAYRDILENYEFPWARAGVARSLHKQNRLTEARTEIDKVVAGTPHFFDASDLKASICMAQGEHAEAQKVLDEVAKKTPRNYLRKRMLAEAATLNGDSETARAAMADVIANDTMPGAVSAEDRLAMARSHVDAGDKISAEKVLVGLRDAEIQAMNLAEQASFAALLAISSPEKGKARFAGLRPALLASELDPSASIDVMRAALTVGDHELADRHTELLMTSPDAKKVFGTIRKQYALQGREQDFREIQKQVALKRIHHEEKPAA